jgi:hypothetical protein
MIMKNVTLIYLLAACLTSVSTKVLAQSPIQNGSTEIKTVQGVCYNTKEELRIKYEELSKDRDFEKLIRDLQNKGWYKQYADNASFGLTANVEDANGHYLYNGKFFVFDFSNEKKGPRASLIWKEIHQDNKRTVYKAYIIMPNNEKDFFKALESYRSEEYYINSDHQVDTAHSWGKCFSKCAQDHCNIWCLNSVGVCAEVAKDLLVGTLGFATAPAVASFFLCSAISCTGCFAVCLFECENNNPQQKK